ncbi:hypothetical protein BURPS1106B_A0685 [Burkholderia pseudomallei 1106b]|uniref:Uncharacterized protein n=1 Tax=Burkholderia pseudomallei (strain 1106a) TaxID=357348 RepID=A3NTP0_BURP0|nr:hypothetical protein BURPS1106A_1438 [Burkholderia pseudomallei 1106a]AFR15363.1 hypothetical protein BPC006_I1484 [Burkholderia pseudomallei BPC006]EES27707.1 hypothetical protein BURPS1106B_A0685 [Burkholderia pseudomallei 1106b]
MKLAYAEPAQYGDSDVCGCDGKMFAPTDDAREFHFSRMPSK